jgi:hypothetical protein
MLSVKASQRTHERHADAIDHCRLAMTHRTSLLTGRCGSSTSPGSLTDLLATVC